MTLFSLQKTKEPEVPSSFEERMKSVGVFLMDFLVNALVLPST